jgi:hypothetical protein
MGDRTTIIRETDGSHTKVETRGGETKVERGGHEVYHSGGDRHQEQVDHSTKQGGEIVSDKHH